MSDFVWFNFRRGTHVWPGFQFFLKNIWAERAAERSTKKNHWAERAAERTTEKKFWASERTLSGIFLFIKFFVLFNDISTNAFTAVLRAEIWPCEKIQSNRTFRRYPGKRIKLHIDIEQLLLFLPKTMIILFLFLFSSCFADIVALNALGDQKGGWK